VRALVCFVIKWSCKLRLRAFKSEDAERLLQLANSRAVFNETISEADLEIKNFFSKWILGC
jgi:hypothetical protein